MSWKFNPPPGWPQQPEGWVPPPGWAPDPSWPPAPPGWQFWVPAESTPVSGPPGAATSAAAGAAPPPGTGQGQPPPGAAPPPPAGTPWPPAGAAPPMAAQPPTGGQPYPGSPGGYGGGPGAPPPYQAAGQAPAGKPWFGRWWTIVVLVGVLLLGAAGGYGGTRVTMDLATEADEASGGDPGAVASTAPSPVPTDPADSLLPPTEPPIDPPDGEFSTVCGEVAVIFLEVSSAGVEEIDDIDDYLDGVVDARRDAADQLRDLETDDSQERSSLDTFADELDESADMADENRRDVDTIEESFDRALDAYFAFNDDHC